MFKRLLRLFTPAGRVATEKRRLEALLKDEGLSRSAARRVIGAYFGGNTPENGTIKQSQKRGR